MSAACVVLVSRDGSVIEHFLRHLGSRPGLILRVVSGLDAEPRWSGRTVVVIQLGSDADRATLDGLLAAERDGGDGRNPAVVALVPRYDENEAADLFRRGLAEYLSLHDHADRVVEIVTGLTAASPASPRRPVALGVAGRRRESRILGRLRLRGGRRRFMY